MIRPGKENEVVSLEQVLMGGLDLDEALKTQENNEEEQEESSEKKEENVLEFDVNKAFEEGIDTEEDNEDDDEINDTSSGKTSKDKDSSETPASRKEFKKDDDAAKESSFTLAFARYQREQGNLTSFDEEELQKVIDEEGEEAALSYLMNKEVESIRTELLDTYEDDVKYFMDLVDSGVDRDLAKDISKNKGYYDSVTVDDLENEDKEELRKRIITHRYELTTNFNPEKIKKLVDRAVSLGEDIEEATEALTEVQGIYKELGEREKQAVKQRQEQAVKRQKELQEDLNNKIESLEEIVPGMKLTKAEKTRIKDSLIKPVSEANGVPLNAIWAKRAKDPFKFDTILAALDMYGVFEGKWDKLTKNTKSKVVEELRDKMRSNTTFKTTINKEKAFQESAESSNYLDTMKKTFGDLGR
jgi:hypothetical protein